MLTLPASPWALSGSQNLCTNTALHTAGLPATCWARPSTPTLPACKLVQLITHPGHSDLIAFPNTTNTLDQHIGEGKEKIPKVLETDNRE